MSFKEVKELRLSGELEKAYDLATTDLSANRTNIWNVRSLVWVIYSLIKRAVEKEDYEEARKMYQEYELLEVPSTEEMIIENFNRFKFYKFKEYVEFIKLSKKGSHLEAFDVLIKLSDKIDSSDYIAFSDKLFWEIYNYLKNLVFKESSYKFIVNYNDKVEIPGASEDDIKLKIISRLTLVKEFYTPKIDLINKLLPIQLLKVQKNFKKIDLFRFFKWFSPLDCLEDESFFEETYNKIKMLSLAERLLISSAKSIIENNKIDEVGNFLEYLDKYIEKYPKYQYLPYYKAKLLLLNGDKDEALSAFIPFAIKKKNEFWVWDLMSELFEVNSNKYLSCLCEAINVGYRQEMLLGVRLKLLKSLIDLKFYKEAKFELDKIIHIREKNNWNVGMDLIILKSAEWYGVASVVKSNKYFYLKYSSLVSEILFNDVDEEIVLVEWVNNKKGMLNFIVSNQRSGFFYYKDLAENIIEGDFLKVRLFGGGVNARYKAYTITKIDVDLKTGLKEKFEGVINIIDNNYGFVEHIFVSKNLIEKNKLVQSDFVKGIKIISYDKKKSKFSWRCLVVE